MSFYVRDLSILRFGIHGKLGKVLELFTREYPGMNILFSLLSTKIRCGVVWPYKVELSVYLSNLERVGGGRDMTHP
jgi:hypothetical protein